ncbi:hypothetical protein AGMMS49928_13910 [Spirochaetia bacterium]|nr:hypothetical protein AGMMS49928_13910 [Spirochaetia bacterium]
MDLLEMLAKQGNNVFVIMNSFLDYAPLSFIRIDFPLKYKRHHLPPASYLFKENIKRNLENVKKVIFDSGVTSIDFLHIHGDIYLKSAIYIKKKMRVPLFYASRCNDVDRAHILRHHGVLNFKEYLFSLVYEPINRFREKQIKKYADIIAFLSTPDKIRFLERTGCSESKTVVIPNHIGPPRFTPEWENKNHSRNVQKLVYVGSLSASKGLWDLLKALAILKNRGYSSLYCSVLGRNEKAEKTYEFVKKLNLTEMVSIEGYKNPFPYFAECDLFIYPTLYDAFGNVITEALHTGCPVIASRVGGIPDLLAYPELLFESGNTGEIADRIERCIKDETFYAHIRKLCAERAEAHRFDWAGKFAEAMENYKGR